MVLDDTTKNAISYLSEQLDIEQAVIYAHITELKEELKNEVLGGLRIRKEIKERALKIIKGVK